MLRAIHLFPKFLNSHIIDALRAKYDPLVQLIPPHITLVFPFNSDYRMIRVGEKLGMQMEARLRKCRYYNGTYYDSIRMGLLREEWRNVSNKNCYMESCHSE